MTIAIVDVTTNGAGILKCKITGLAKSSILARYKGIRLKFGYDGVCQTPSVIWDGSKIDPIQLAQIEAPEDAELTRLPPVTIGDCTMAVSAWCKRYGRAHRSIIDRIKNGENANKLIEQIISEANKEPPLARERVLWACMSCEWIDERRKAGSDGTFIMCPKCKGRLVKA